MRKFIKIHHLFLVILLAVSLIGLGNPVFSATTVTIDPNVKYVTFEGWGTSLCWFADGLGDWSDPKRNAIADLLFSASSGLGFNVVRYNIGGGENPSHSHMRENANIPSFQPSPGVWDWNADPRQRWFLTAAKTRGANIFEAFSNSPPYWMTKSQCASGNTDGSNNLKDDYYDDFAEYLTEVVKHFRDYWGTTFQTLDPMNEPIATWWTSGGRQEGCHFDRAKQVTIIKEVGARLASKGLSTKVSASDECSIDDAVASLNYYDSASLGYISQINTHAYGGSQRTQLYNLAQSKGKKLWMSEYGNTGEDINGALTLTGTIIKDLREMKPSVWAHWQPIENENLAPTWGMIHARFSGAEDYHITKQYYGMANFSKFIRPGYDIIGSSDANTVCAYSASAQKLVIVIRNGGTSDVSYSYDLSGFSSTGSSAATYRTSSTEDLATLANTSISNKVLNATAKAQSITTYIVSNVVKGSGSSVTIVNDNTTGTGNNQFEYVGSWSYGSQTGAYNNDNHWEGDTNGYYQVRFYGKQIKVYVAKNTNHGIAAISIDNGAETNVDCYSSSRQDQALIYTSPTLSTGQHTLKVRVTGTKNGSSSGVVITADRVDIIN